MSTGLRHSVVGLVLVFVPLCAAGQVALANRFPANTDWAAWVVDLDIPADGIERFSLTSQLGDISFLPNTPAANDRTVVPNLLN